MLIASLEITKSGRRAEAARLRADAIHGNQHDHYLGEAPRNPGTACPRHQLNEQDESYRSASSLTRNRTSWNSDSIPDGLTSHSLVTDAEFFLLGSEELELQIARENVLYLRRSESQDPHSSSQAIACNDLQSSRSSSTTEIKSPSYESSDLTVLSEPVTSLLTFNPTFMSQKDHHQSSILPSPDVRLSQGLFKAHGGGISDDGNLTSSAARPDPQNCVDLQLCSGNPKWLTNPGFLSQMPSM